MLREQAFIKCFHLEIHLRRMSLHTGKLTFVPSFAFCAFRSGNILVIDMGKLSFKSDLQSDSLLLEVSVIPLFPSLHVMPRKVELTRVQAPEPGWRTFGWLSSIDDMRSCKQRGYTECKK